MKHNEATRMRIPVDLSETAFIEALCDADMAPSRAVVVVTPGNYPTALELKAKYSCKTVFVPEGFFANRDQWLIIGPEASAWSESA